MARVLMPVLRERITAVILIVVLQASAATALQGQAASDSGKIPGWPAGVRAEGSYTGDFFVPTSGGLSREAVYLDNLDLLLDIDLEVVLDASKTSLRVHVQSNRGSSVSSRVGDLQGLSNIEAPTEWRLYEAWVEHNLVPGRLSILGGIFDVNAEFDVVPAAGEFLNSSFGFGPDYSLTGVNGPSTFPLTTLGVRLKARPLSRVYVELAVSDGSPGDPSDPERSRFALGDGEGALISWEVGYSRAAPDVMAIFDEPPSRVQKGGRRIGRGRTTQRMRTKLAGGGWAYTRKFEAWDSDEPEGTSLGLYLLAERLIFEEPEGRGGLSVFARAGMASSDVNQLSHYAGAGVVYSGFLPGRPDDIAAFGVAYARNGSAFMRAQRLAGDPVERAETVLEVNYRAQFGEFFHLQPNLQWVVNPGMNPEVENALVAGIRGMITVELP